MDTPAKDINKFAILMTDKTTGKKVLFSSVKKFCDVLLVPRATVYNWTSRKGAPYETKYYIIEKIPFYAGNERKYVASDLTS